MPGAVTVGSLIINMSANTAQLKSDYADATADTKSTAQGIVNAWAGVTAETDKANEAGARLVAQLKNEITTFGMTDAELKQHKANLAGVGSEAQVLIARLQGMKDAEATFKATLNETNAALMGHGKEAREASGHVDGFSFSTNAAKRELLVLAHELSQGNYKKFGGSMLVLGEQTGAAGLLFSGAGLAALGLAGAVAAVAAIAIKANNEVDDFNKALIVTNGASGLTRDGLHAMAANIETMATGGIRTATRALEELSATGRYSGQALEETGRVALKLSALTGQSSEEIIKSFDGMSHGVANWAAEANKQYNFINGVQYEHIRQLEMHGQKNLAVVETMKLLDASLDIQSRKIGYWAANAEGWADMLGRINIAMGKFFTTATGSEKVEIEIRRLKELEDSYKGVFANDPSARADFLKSHLAEQRKAVHDAIAAANAEEIAAAKKHDDTLANQQSVADTIELDMLKKKIMTKEQKRELAAEKINGIADRENARAKAQGLAEVVTMEQRQAMIDAADEKWHDKAVKGEDDRAKLRDGALLAEKTLLDREKSLYDERDKMLALYHSKFGLSDADFYSGREAARAEYIAAEAKAFKAEKALTDSFVGSNPEQVAANKNKYAELLRQHLEFNDKMQAARGEDAANELALQQAIEDASDAAINKYLTGLDEEAKKLEDANIGREQSKGAIEREALARTNLSIVLQQQLIAEQNLNGRPAGTSADDWDKETKAAEKFLKILLDIRAQGTRKAAALDQADSDKVTKKLAEQAIQDWKNVGASIADSLSNAFGNAGRAAGGMFKAYADNAAHQLEINKQLAESTKTMGADDPQRIAAADRAHQLSAEAQIKSYADMASAAEGFFEKGSRGYQAMHTASQVLHAAEVALSLIKGVNAVLTQGEGDPYSAFARMASMAAIVAGLGVAIAGGGGSSGPSAADRQASAGTGSVLGDDKAKSDSIAKAIADIDKNSGLGLVHSADMVNSLHTIANSMTSLSSLVVRTAGLTAGSTGVTEGTSFKPGALGYATDSIFGFATILSEKIPVFGAVITKLFGTTTSVVDQGIAAFSASLKSVQDVGIQAQSYADIQSTSHFFGIKTGTSTSTQTSNLPSEIGDQFALVVKSLASGVTAAANALSLGGDAFTAKLQTFVVDIGSISIKGLTGDEIQKQFEAIFSKLGDDMAKFGVAGLADFQKVGEGYFETLTRVANDLTQTKDVFAVLGKTMTATGIDGVKSSEALIAAAGGLDKLTGGTKSFIDSFLSDAERLAPVAASVTARMAALGEADIKTADQFKSLVLAQDLNTTAGQALYASLIEVAPAFKQVTDATDKINSTKAGLAIELANAGGDTKEATRLTRAGELADLAKIDPSLVALKEHIYAVADAAVKANDALAKAKASEDERNGLQDQIDELTMSSTDLMKKHSLAYKDENQDKYDELQRDLKAKAIAEERKGLQDQLDAATMDSTALLKKQHDAYLPANQALFDQVQAALATKKAADDLASTNKSVQDQIDALNKSGKSLQQQRDDELIGVDDTTKALLKHLFALQDAAKATADAATAAANLTAANKSVQDQIDALVKAGLPLEKQRELEVSGLDDSTKALKERLFALQDEAAATAAAAAKAASVAQERKTIQDQLDQLTLGAAGLLAKQRDALDESNRALFDQVQAETAAKAAIEAAAARAKAILDERKGLQDQLDQITLSAAELNKKQRDALDASNRSLYDQIGAEKALRDAADAAAARDKEIADERKGLQDQLDQLTMTSTELLNKQRDAIHGVNRALFDQIQAAQAAKNAADEAIAAAKASADAFSNLVKSKRDLDIQYMEAIGNAEGALAAKREDALAALDASLRGEQAAITAALDAAAANKAAADAYASLTKSKRDLDIQYMEAVGNAEGALAARRSDALQALDASLRGEQQAITAALDASAAIKKAQDSARSSLTEAYQRETKAAQDLKTQMSGLFDSLGAYGNGLRADAMTPAQRLAQTHGEFAAVLAAVASGSTAALQQLQGMSQQYIEAAKAADAASGTIFADMQSTLDKAIADSAAKVDAARAVLDGAYGRESSAIQATIDKHKAYAQSLRDFRDSLTLGNLSSLSPEQKYNEARRQLETAGPDKIQGAIQTFLESSQRYNASSAPYAKDEAYARSLLDASISGAEHQQTDAERQLTALQTMVSGLLTVNQTEVSVHDAITALLLAQSQVVHASGTAGGQVAGAVSQTTTAVNEVLAALQVAGTQAHTQVGLAQSQLDVLNSQVTGLIDINASVISVHDAVLALQSALAMQMPAGQVFQNPTAPVVQTPPVQSFPDPVAPAGPSVPAALQGLHRNDYTATYSFTAANGEVWQGGDDLKKQALDGFNFSFQDKSILQGIYDKAKRLGLNGDDFDSLANLAGTNFHGLIAQTLGVPAFAAGGDHLGGMALVGETGPEWINTGPARVFNAAQTKQILGGGENKELIDAMLRVEALLEQLVERPVTDVVVARGVVQLRAEVEKVNSTLVQLKGN